MNTKSPVQAAADELQRILISDVERDLEVVARELNLTPAMAERCRRALDRLQAVQQILGVVAADDGGIQGRAVVVLREAMQFLAREWPAEYPAHAVEWMLVGDSCVRREREKSRAYFEHAFEASPRGGFASNATKSTPNTCPMSAIVKLVQCWSVVLKARRRNLHRATLRLFHLKRWRLVRPSRF
jgi:hypothetical protein